MDNVYLLELDAQARAKIKSDAWRIANTLESGGVVRYHTTPACGLQSDAAHQWGVAVLAAVLKPDIHAAELLAVLSHDTPELFTGDIPAPFKEELERVCDNVIESREEDIKRSYFLPAFADFCNNDVSAQVAGIVQIADKLEALYHTSQAPTTPQSLKVNRGLAFSAERLLEDYREDLSDAQYALAGTLIERWSK